MAKQILTSVQKTFLNKFSKSNLAHAFYFSGGTALSHFYLQHRLSEDLDFFSVEEFEIQPITLFIKSLKLKLGFVDFDFQQSFNRNIFQLRFEDKTFLKAEFTYYPFSQIEVPEIFDGIAVDSLGYCGK